jgi:hypothetical protein
MRDNDKGQEIRGTLLASLAEDGVLNHLATLDPRNLIYKFPDNIHNSIKPPIPKSLVLALGDSNWEVRATCIEILAVFARTRTSFQRILWRLQVDS